MKTLLIPVDFSGATENVIKYAAGFSCDTHVERIILLKSYYVSVYAQLMPSADFVQLSAEDIDEERRGIEASLKHLAHELKKTCVPSIQIKTALSELPLTKAILQLIADEQPNMVMLGTDKSLYEDDGNISDQIIAIVKISTVPVMIVPNHTEYKKIEEALVPCDFGAISRLSALEGFRDRKKWLHPKLMILNVGSRQKNGASEEKPAGLAELLEDYEYDIYHSEDKDTVHGILDFADENDPQLIIALPGKYSFFYNLTHHSITQALALNANRSVLILK